MTMSTQDGKTQRIRIEQHSAAGLLWFGGWLFTIGFLKLTSRKAALALFIWTYYLGTYFAQPH